MNINILTDEQLARELAELILLNTGPGLCLTLAKFTRQCVKDSQPKGLSVEEIRNILYADDTIDPIPPYRCLPPIDKTTANVKALAIHTALYGDTKPEEKL